MVRQSVTDQVRNFPFLCHFLANPSELISQTAFHIPQKQCQQLVNVYYDFDEVIVRELIGVKFKAINRKGLENLAEKTKRAQHTIKRINDNLRTIYQFATKIQDESISTKIQEEFLISKELARQYVSIIFLCVHKFESSKKRLANVTFRDFLEMGEEMSTNWCTTPQSDDKTIVDLRTFQLNKEFVDSLKALKPYFTKEIIEEYKQKIVIEFGENSKVEKELTAFLKNLIALAVSLGGREIKDYFVTLSEKILASLKERMEFESRPQARTLLRKIKETFNSLSLPADVKHKYQTHWNTFLTTVWACIRIFYGKKM